MCKRDKKNLRSPGLPTAYISIGLPPGEPAGRVLWNRSEKNTTRYSAEYSYAVPRLQRNRNTALYRLGKESFRLFI